MDHNNHLNFFRLLFALQVVFFHSQGWLNLPKGGVMFDFLALFPGVPLFFIVSGFLITDSYLNSTSLKEYFIKRGLRIYPALFVNILILEFVMYLGGNMMGNNISIAQYIIYFFTYVATAVNGIASAIVGLKGTDIYNYTAFFHDYPSGVLWTLTVELSFYVLLPMVLFFKNNKIRNGLLLFLSLISIYITFYISSYGAKEFYESSSLGKLLQILILPYFWIFGLGVFMRLYWLKIKKYFIGYGVYYLGVYLLYCVGSTYVFGELGNYKTELNVTTIIQTIFLAFAMFSMAFSYTYIKFNRKLDLSYSTYLYHMLIVQILIGFGIIGSAYLYLVVIGATLFIAYLSWIYVEKPMLSLKKVSK